LHSMVIPTLPSLLLLLLSPKLSFATDGFMSGWKRTPKSIRCRPSVRVEAGTCRKRTFGGATQAVLDASLVAGLSITIPIPQLETEALFYTPFSFAVQDVFNFTGRQMEVQGRNIQERSTIYTKLETMLGSISATDGHACMLRAMCEASAAPLHSDGLLGDALNLLLSAGHALVGGSEEDIGSYREYSEAQTEGMVSGDCSSYGQFCPISFFDFLSNGINSL